MIVIKAVILLNFIAKVEIKKYNIAGNWYRSIITEKRNQGALVSSDHDATFPITNVSCIGTKISTQVAMNSLEAKPTSRLCLMKAILSTLHFIMLMDEMAKLMSWMLSSIPYSRKTHPVRGNCKPDSVISSRYLTLLMKMSSMISCIGLEYFQFSPEKFEKLFQFTFWLGQKLTV